MTDAPIKILMDTSVWGHGELADLRRQNAPEWTNQFLFLHARQESSDPWLKSQIEALPTVARLARENAIEFYRTEDLIYEGWHSPKSFGPALGNIFKDIKVKYVTPAVRRGVFLHEGIEPGDLEKFCVWILNAYSPRWLEAPLIKRHITAAQVQSLSNIDRFKKLCSSLSQRHFPDVFHLWSAEIAGMKYFLTTDKNFKSTIRQKKLTLPCKPVSATELLVMLRVTARDPLPFKYGCKYLIGGRLFEEPSGKLEAQMNN